MPTSHAPTGRPPKVVIAEFMDEAAIAAELGGRR